MNPAIEIVREESARLGVDLGAAELQHFDKYLALLNKWSASVNVVGTRDLTEVARYHLADSVALVPHLTGRRRIVDVGSGAGLPGAVLAICLPGASVTSLEPIHKKHAFLSAVKRELKLDNFTAFAERDEQHRARPDFQPFEAAVSRATWALPEWLERGALLVEPGGLILGMEGRERDDLPAGASRHSYELGGRTRAIVLLRS